MKWVDENKDQKRCDRAVLLELVLSSLAPPIAPVKLDRY